MFNVFIQMVAGDEFYHIPIMQDRRSKRHHAGSLVDRYPTPYTKRTLGPAVAFALSVRDSVQVRPQIPDAWD